jgi:hypothetical protein
MNLPREKNELIEAARPFFSFFENNTTLLVGGSFFAMTCYSANRSRRAYQRLQTQHEHWRRSATAAAATSSPYELQQLEMDLRTVVKHTKARKLLTTGSSRKLFPIS